MDPASARTLLLIGSGPGIGVAVASLFAQKHFDHIALFARNPSQLQADKETILSSAADVGRQVKVRTWKVDISDLEQFKAALTEVQSFGTLECVYFNAARVGGSNFFDFAVEDIELDLKVSVTALYVAVQWAIPILASTMQTNPGIGGIKPTILVTSSLLPVDPIPEYFSLSMAKAAQANLVKSLQKFVAKGTRVGMVIVGGIISPDSDFLNPITIAEQAWQLFNQDGANWKAQVSILEDGIDWCPRL
ncbi:short-chain alcohol dehydrogenase [Aspergillus bombycis]|uniref:Short-chain alcohol dehydrogenase n=1 Tax=Aspergillus bombycis TaxID=109264 RepID=A0A1F8A2G5_9EURO|nr:short-chain alcohol dehydrogenase [Aspergillus bombycis]OGM45914.1 short-chain alcohol dehydrogenase [Aspergillus bombycis]